MKIYNFLSLLILILMLGACGFTQRNGIKVSENGDEVLIENTKVRIAYDLKKGTYKAIDKNRNITAIYAAHNSVNNLNSCDSGVINTYKEEKVNDNLGSGASITISGKKDKQPELLIKFTLYNHRDGIFILGGLTNSLDTMYRIHTINPVSNAKIFEGKDMNRNFRLLDGNGGGIATFIRKNPAMKCYNNMILHFGDDRDFYSMVAGGVSYHDFAKYVTVDDTLPKSANSLDSLADFRNIHVQLYAEDKIGKLVDSKATYLPEKDAFYIDFVTANPIESAEKYALAIRDAQAVKLNYYYFPTVCLWYAMEPKFGGRNSPAVNDSQGAVEEMKRVSNSGFLNYTTVGIRLVPDCYGLNNENGWWDDVHWQMYGSGLQSPGMKLKGAHYRIPYETTEKWASEVTRLGGIPFFYFQTAVRSNDYAEKYPKQMLFNESHHKVDVNYAINKGFSTYDFTDKDFIAHMREVYKNLKDAGVQGLMFDYPHTGWNENGGMDDQYVTTVGAYRKIFELAHDGLGEKAWVQERNIRHGSDATLGLVESQRTQGDTDELTPEMVLRDGLRWYKNRVVINYDMDAKNLNKAQPSDNEDGINKLLTMSYVAASRLLLSNSFGGLTPRQVYKLSRIFPFHTSAQSARPLDAFVSDYPRIYGFKVDDKWIQITFYNENSNVPKTISLNLSGIVGRGGAGLNPEKEYHVYDFWNDAYLGKHKGSERLEQNLRKGEARMLSVREVEPNPQVLSTDRHIMQGMLELCDIVWDSKTKILHGKAHIIRNEQMNITIALNGYKAKSATSQSCLVSILSTKDDIVKLNLLSDVNHTADWKLAFE